MQDQLFSTTGEAELGYRVAILPARRHRPTLISRIEALMHNDVEEKLLPFDNNAARVHAHTSSATSSPLYSASCQIAPATRCRSIEVAACVVWNFDDIKIESLNLWAVA